MKKLSTWQATWHLVRTDPRAYLTFSLLYIIGFATTLAPGLLLQRIFDGLSGDPTASQQQIWGLLALLAGVGCARAGIDLWRTFSEEAFRCRGWTRLRGNLTKNALRRPGALRPPTSPGDAISRLESDVMELADWPSWLPYVLAQAIAALTALVIMLRISLPLTALSVLPTLAVIAIVSRSRDRMLRYAHLSRGADSEIREFLGEVLDGVTAIKAATAEGHVIQHLRRLNDARRRAEVRWRLYMALLAWAHENIADLALGALLLLASQALKGGSFTIGDFALFVAYLPLIAEFPATLGGFLADYQTQQVSIDRLLALQPDADPIDLVALQRARPPQPAAAVGDRLARLTATGLTYHYPQSDEAGSPADSRSRGITDVSLTIARGEFVAITGRVGSGKTTLLRALLGLLPVQQGEIRWNGSLVDHPSDALGPPRTAYVPQVPRLLSSSLRENILLGHPADDAALHRALHIAVLEPDLATMPAGLETMVGPRGMRLSGGQVQRAAVARMLVRTPELMVLDDVSSALDAATEQLLWERLFALTDATCIAVTHRRRVLERADRILVMGAGRVVAEGTVAHLLATSAAFGEIWRTASES